MLQIGDILDNKYKILSEIGRGGMSVVYLAINERANKTWAVKEVRKDGVMDYTAVRQGLLVETEMMKRFNHPGLPSIIDVIDSDDTFIIVMDYIEGSSLLKLLKTEGAQPESRVVEWGKQLCDVLGYLHRQSPPVIYRDMKPANVMLKPDGSVALIDFGTAREFKDRDMVEDTTCLGTRGYAAPEQYGGKGQTDARTDIYCLGATMYHLLTGHNPAEPPYEIKPLRYWLSQYAGSGLEKLIAKCTKQDAQERYQSCEELMYALEHYGDEDDAVKRNHRIQITAFIASAAIGVAALTGMAFFKHSWNNALNESYDNLLSQAMYQDTFEQSESYFLKAMEIDAGKPQAYEDLLEKAAVEIAKDDKLRPGTATIINECLTSRPEGTRTNIEVLKDQSPETYARVMYEIGLWYFFMKDNTDADRQTAASNYLTKITENERYLSSLPAGHQEMAKLMADIGGYIGNLGSKIGQISDSASSYAVLYEDLAAMVSGDLKEKVGLDYYCISIYQQIAYWIDQKGSDFISAGIPVQELENLLQNVSDGLIALNITEENDLYEEYQHAFMAVETAEKTVKRL